MYMKLVYLLYLPLVFFTYNTSQAKNKRTIEEKQDQPPKRRPML